MKFKLDTRLILFFCCLCLIGVSSKKSSKGGCMRSLHSIKHQLLECHGKYLCNKSMDSKCKCIGKDLLCNEKPDCPGGEDEKNCTKKVPVCPPKQMICPGSLKCATPCNNHSECDNGEDEQGCVPTCKDKEMICHDGKCATICDNKPECEDGRDETECKKKQCGALPVVPYGHFHLLNPEECYKDDHAMLNCSEGYMTEGTPITVQCKELTNGTLYWETNHGTCVKKSCTGTPGVNNGDYKVACGDGKVGDCAILVCKPDFCLYPESLDFESILCMPNTMWSTPGNGSCVSTGNCATGGTITGTAPLDAVSVLTLANDGNRATLPTMCYLSGAAVLNPKITLTTNTEKPIKRIELIHDGTVLTAASDIVVTVGTTVCPRTTFTTDQITFNCESVVMANTVMVQNTGATTQLSVCELEAYSFMAKCNGLQ